MRFALISFLYNIENSYQHFINTFIHSFFRRDGASMLYSFHKLSFFTKQIKPKT